MAPDDPRNYEWLDRYLAGEGTEDERRTWQRRVDADPRLREVVDRIGRVWPNEPEPPAWDVDAAWKDAVRRERRRQPVVAHQWWTRAAIAAGVLLVLGSAAVLARMGWPAHEYVTAAGERLTITLDDGTQVAMAPATRLRVPLAYRRGSRDVVLRGEAFFRVVHNAAHPFRVRTGDVTATDVGTAFDVRSYPGDSTLAISVVEGAVDVTTGRARAEPLAAGDVAAVGHGGVITRAHIADLAPYIGWTRGELVFHDAPLADVTRALERWYGVTIVLADPALARRPVLATYDMQSMTDVLALLTATVGAHYTQTGRTITVVPGPAH